MPVDSQAALEQAARNLLRTSFDYVPGVSKDAPPITSQPYTGAYAPPEYQKPGLKRTPSYMPQPSESPVHDVARTTRGTIDHAMSRVDMVRVLTPKDRETVKQYILRNSPDGNVSTSVLRKALSQVNAQGGINSLRKQNADAMAKAAAAPSTRNPLADVNYTEADRVKGVQQALGGGNLEQPPADQKPWWEAPDVVGKVSSLAGQMGNYAVQGVHNAVAPVADVISAQQGPGGTLGTGFDKIVEGIADDQTRLTAKSLLATLRNLDPLQVPAFIKSVTSGGGKGAKQVASGMGDMLKKAAFGDENAQADVAGLVAAGLLGHAKVSEMMTKAKVFERPATEPMGRTPMAKYVPPVEKAAKGSKATVAPVADAGPAAILPVDQDPLFAPYIERAKAMESESAAKTNPAPVNSNEAKVPTRTEGSVSEPTKTAENLPAPMEPVATTGTGSPQAPTRAESGIAPQSPDVVIIQKGRGKGKAALPEGAVKREGMSGVPYYDTRLKTKDIGVEPGMQFRTKVDEATGTDARLKDVTTYSEEVAPSLTVWLKNDGSFKVINGHHRLELAKRAGHDSLPVKVYREKDGVTFEDARTLGAMQNIIENKATATDAARVMRHQNVTIDQLVGLGLSKRTNLARDAGDLTKLSDEAFGHVERGMVPEEVAAGIASRTSDPTIQINAVKNAQEMGLTTRRDGELLAEKSMKLGKVNKGTESSGGQMGFEDMFGAPGEPDYVPMKENIQIHTAVERQLGTNKRLFHQLLNGKRAGETRIDRTAQEMEAAQAEYGSQALNSDEQVQQVLLEESRKYAENPTDVQFKSSVDAVTRAAAEAAKRRFESTLNSANPAGSEGVSKPSTGGVAPKTEAPKAEAKAAEPSAAKAETPVAAPEPTAETGSTVSASEYKLPKELSQSKPRYGYKDQNFTLEFESDFDRAAYVVAKRGTLSAADQKFVDHVTQSTGLTLDQIAERGNQVREQIKQSAGKVYGDPEATTIKIQSDGQSLPSTVAKTDHFEKFRNAVRDAQSEGVPGMGAGKTRAEYKRLAVQLTHGDDIDLAMAAKEFLDAEDAAPKPVKGSKKGSGPMPREAGAVDAKTLAAVATGVGALSLVATPAFQGWWANSSTSEKGIGAAGVLGGLAAVYGLTHGKVPNTAEFFSLNAGRLDPTTLGRRYSTSVENVSQAFGKALNKFVDAKAEHVFQTHRDLGKIGKAAETHFGKNWLNSKEFKDGNGTVRDIIEQNGVDGKPWHEGLAPAWKSFIEEVKPVMDNLLDEWESMGGRIKVDNDGFVHNILDRMVANGQKPLLITEDGSHVFYEGTRPNKSGALDIVVSGEKTGEEGLIRPGDRFGRPVDRLGEAYVPRIFKGEFADMLKEAAGNRDLYKQIAAAVYEGKTAAELKAMFGGEAQVAKAAALAKMFEARNPLGKLTADEAFGSYIDQITPEDVSGSDINLYMANLEKERRWNLSKFDYVDPTTGEVVTVDPYETSYVESVAKYVNKGWGRVSLSRQFGVDNAVIGRVITGIRESNPNYGAYLEKTLGRTFGIGPERMQPDVMRTMNRISASYQTLSKMTAGTSHVSQASDIVFSLTKTGAKNVLGATYDVFFNPEREDIRLDADALGGVQNQWIADIDNGDHGNGFASGNILSQARQEMAKGTAKIRNGDRMAGVGDYVGSIMTAIGFRSMDRTFKRIAAISAVRDAQAALASVQKAAAKGKVNSSAMKTLEFYGIKDRAGMDPMALTADDAAMTKIGQTVRHDLTYSGAPEDFPLWTTSAFGSMVTRFKKPQIMATRFLLEHVCEPALKGDFAPLAKFAAYSIGLGTGVTYLKELIRGTGMDEGTKALINKGDIQGAIARIFTLPANKTMVGVMKDPVHGRDLRTILYAACQQIYDTGGTGFLGDMTPMNRLNRDITGNPAPQPYKMIEPVDINELETALRRFAGAYKQGQKDKAELPPKLGNALADQRMGMAFEEQLKSSFLLANRVATLLDIKSDMVRLNDLKKKERRGDLTPVEAVKMALLTKKVFGLANFVRKEMAVKGQKSVTNQTFEAIGINKDGTDRQN